MYKLKRFGWALIGMGALFGGRMAVAAENNQQSVDEAAGQAHEENPVCTGSGVTLTFDSGSTAINDRGRSSLNGVARWLEQEDGRTVHVDGYADKTGNAEKNEALSEKRAEAAKRYLVAKGIEPDRIMAAGHGENDAVDKPDLKDTRAVAVTTCESPVAMNETETTTTTTTETVQEPAAEPPPPAPAPVAPPTNVSVNVVQPPPPPAPEPKHTDRPPSQIGVQATIGGGATDFVEDGARNFTDIGGSWDGRLSVGTRTPITVEGSYVGSAQGLNAFGRSDDTLLIGQGAEGDVRLNLTTWRIQPYIFGGVGWMNYQVRNGDLSQSDVTERDNILTVPFGVGISGRIAQGLILDVRGTGRATYGDTLFNRAATLTAVSGNTGMNSWNASANLGWEF